MIPLDPKIVKALSDKFGEESVDKFFQRYNDFITTWIEFNKCKTRLVEALRKAIKGMEEA